MNISIEYVYLIVILSSINVIAALGVSILTGYTGLFSIGHAGFMALGGYASAVLVRDYHVPFVIALLIGGLFAAVCSLLIGYPTFRGKLRGDYFAIATLGFAESIRLLLNNTYEIKLTNEIVIKTNGAYGFMNIPMHTTMPVILISLGLALYFAHMFVTSQWGKNCIAIAQDEVAAQMMGVNLMKTKLTALFISAFYAGVAGGLMGFYMKYLTPSFFNFDRSSGFLAAVVFGGIQSLIGPFITGFILVAVPEVLRSFAEYRLVIYGMLFVIVMLFRPQGLLGYVEMNLNFARRWWKKLFPDKDKLSVERKGNI
jgi:branched-chain amino acid transport system permease protein